MTKFHTDDPHESAILEVISCEPEEQYRACITLRKPSLKVEFKTPTASLGNAKILAVEIFDWVIKYATMLAVSSLRAVNRRTRLLVDASLPYKHIISSAPHISATLARTGVADHFTVEEVFWVMTHPACRDCGDFGMYLWIPDLERCCYNCLVEEPDLMPMTERDARGAYGLTKRHMAQIPVVLGLPGRYRDYGKAYRGSGNFVSERRAQQLGLAVHGGEDGLAEYTASSTSKTKAAYDKRMAERRRPYSLDSRGRLNDTKNCIERYLVSVHLPYFDVRTLRAHRGLACVGCEAAMGMVVCQSYEEQSAMVRCQLTAHSEEGLLDHFEECAGAQELVKSASVADGVKDVGT